jgi:hypothetical protein
MSASVRIIGLGTALALLSSVALSQGPQPGQFQLQQPPPQQFQLQQPQPQQSQPQQSPPPVTWERMPRMQLEAEYGGPMKDTAIQRWRDPTADVICYLYIPFTAQHSPPTQTGYVQYGSNIIGSISCLPAPSAGALAKPAKPPGPAPVAKAK